MKSKLSIPIEFEKIEDIKNGDERFTRVKIYILHLGKNYNNSVFEKDVVDEALPTLCYIPIVGFIENNNLDEKDFSDHRYVISKNENGVYRKYLGSAYGVIPSSDDNNAHYETRIDDNNVERTYLVCEGIVWNMFEDSSNIMNRDIIKSQSMELDENSIDGYEDDDGTFHFTRFSFRASCILGDDYEPAMSGSTVEVQFTMSDFVKNLQSELNDKFATFSKLIKENSEAKINKGGIGIMPNTDFTQTALSMFEDISTIVGQYEVIMDRWGDNVPRFYLQDIQDNEVIVVDRKNNYHYFGYQFSMNGDKPEIDFACGKRKKVRYENYEEDSAVSEGGFDFGKHISEIEDAAFEKISEANAKASTAEQDKVVAETNYTQIKTDYDEIKPKYDAYVLAEEQRRVDELNAQKDAKFAEYEDVLSDNADFSALKERKDELSIDEIEKECAVLYVKINRQKSNFSKTTSTSSATVEIMPDGHDDNKNYVSTKYGNIPVKR